MPKSKISFIPADITVEIDSGATVSEAARKAGLTLRQGCSGKKLCGLCKVKIQGDNIPEPSEGDKARLSDKELADGIRLGCKTSAADGMKIELTPAFTGLNLKVDKPFSVDLGLIDPIVFSTPLSLNPPDLSDNLGDLDRILRSLETDKKYSDVKVKFEFLPHLSKTLREGDWKATAVLREKVSISGQMDLLDIISGEVVKDHALYGVALDIGTTTIAGYLVDLNSGKHIFSYAAPNPQAAYGSDVVSRLDVCKRKGEPAISMLQNLLLHSSKQIIKRLCKLANIHDNSIYIITAVGNTVMQNLMLGINPAGLMEAPYTAATVNYPEYNACKLELIDSKKCSHHCSLINLPGVAGYFGSDAVAAAMIAGSWSKTGSKKEGVTLCIDIGTNGEVILITPTGRILGCSTAAGPAFEGAHIKYGLPPVSGAISNLNYDGTEFTFDIIGPKGDIISIKETQDFTEDNYPQGLTGAAVLELTAILKDQELLESSGKLVPEGRLGDRVREDSRGQSEFVLISKDDPDRSEIVLTQEDVREVQLAKGAICAGIKTIMEHGEASADDIQTVILAGAFGSRISVNSVRKIGLLPVLPKAKMESVGNAAGAGAIKAMLSKKAYSDFMKLAKKIEYIELAIDKNFNEYFVESMRF